MTESIHPTPTYFGNSLDLAINTVNPERKPLIDNFLYEKSSLMLYADDGAGKSVLTLQACMQATVKDSKVFGEFNVPEPRNVLYFQMERHPDESFERIRHLKTVIPFDSSKFALSVTLQDIDLQEPKSHANALLKVVETIEEIGFKPEIVAFDPIYTLASSGLETAEACNAITRFFRMIQIHLTCSILATSHTNRGVRSTDPEKMGKREGQDMYGNRFLSAFFTGSYHITSKDDGVGSKWKLNKNSQKNLEKSFELLYDPSTYQSMFLSDGKFSKKDKLDNYLKACKGQNIELSYDDMQRTSGLSDSALRGYLSGYLKDKLEKSSKAKFGKQLYKFLG